MTTVEVKKKVQNNNNTKEDDSFSEEEDEGNTRMTFNHIVETISKVLALGLVLFQGLVVNKYLTMLYNTKWWCWVIADVSIIALWISFTVIVNKWLHRRLNRLQNNPNKSGNEIKFTYIAWLAYVLLLCPRVVILFSHLVKTLDNADTFGPTFLKVSVACSPIIFFLLVHGSHTSKNHTIKNLSIGNIALVGALDLFDSIDLLEFLFLPEEGVKFPPGYGYASLIFFCISFLLPVFGLYGLQYKSTPGQVSSLTFKVAGVVCNLFLLNIPNLIIRSVLWHVYRIDSSVLIMKNVLGIIIGIYELLEYVSENRQVRCKYCKGWFERSMHGDHKTKCKDSEGIALSPKKEIDQDTISSGNQDLPSLNQSNVNS